MPGRGDVDRGHVLAALAAPDEEHLPPDALDLAEVDAADGLGDRRVVRVVGRAGLGTKTSEKRMPRAIM